VSGGAQMRRLIRARLSVELFLSILCLLGIPWALLGQAQPQTSLPPKTAIHVRLIHQLDSIRTQDEGIFAATLSDPVVVDDRTVFARGTEAIGRVREVQKSNLQHPASITLELTEVAGVSIRTSPLRINWKASLLDHLKPLGADGSAISSLSGIAWEGRGGGGGIGFSIDGGNGTAAHYRRVGNELVLPAGTALVFKSEHKGTRQR